MLTLLACVSLLLLIRVYASSILGSMFSSFASIFLVCSLPETFPELIAYLSVKKENNEADLYFVVALNSEQNNSHDSRSISIYSAHNFLIFFRCALVFYTILMRLVSLEFLHFQNKLFVTLLIALLVHLYQDVWRLFHWFLCYV